MSVLGTFFGALVPWRLGSFTRSRWEERRPVTAAVIKERPPRPAEKDREPHQQRETFDLVWDDVSWLPPNHTLNVVEMSKRLAKASGGRHEERAIQQRVFMMVRSGVLKKKGSKPHTRVSLAPTTLTKDEAYEYHRTWYGEFRKQ